MKLIDLHCDTAYRMHRDSSMLAQNKFHISLDKICNYQNYGQLMAIFISNKLSDEEGYHRFFEIYGYYASQIASNSTKAAFLTDGSRLQSTWESNKVALFLSVEDARILNNDIERLNVLYEKGVRYFPYRAIEHYLELKGDLRYIYLIDKDFFSQKGSELFREVLREKGTILSLIALPESFFLDNSCTKSILILDNNPSIEHASTEVFILPPLSEQGLFLNVMNKIQEHLKK